MKFKSAMVTQVSGSVGGMTGSHNRGGLYFRSRAIPVNPNSSFQLEIRNALSQLVTRWTETLTPAQRAAWDLYAANVPKLDTLGDPRFLTGQQWYIAANVPRLQAVGLAIVDDGPVIFNTGTFTLPVPSYTGGSLTVSVAITNTDEWASEVGASMLIYQGNPQNGSRTFYAGPYRFIGQINGAATPPTSPQTRNVAFIGDPGNLMPFYVRVSRLNGRLSAIARINVIAA